MQLPPPKRRATEFKLIPISDFASLKNGIWNSFCLRINGLPILKPMKLFNTILFLCLIFITTDFSCKKESSAADFHLGDPFQVKINEIVTLSPSLSTNVSDSNINVKFQKVINDSRCSKASCYLCYGSSATIQVSLTDNTTNIEIPLTILGCTDEYKCDDNLYYKVDTLGYRICLLRLDPYPGDNVAIDPLSYTAKLSIAKH
jgi:hypothetical protein